jgi:hypothetical protein
MRDKNCGFQKVIYMQGEAALAERAAMYRVLLSRPLPKFSCEHALTTICPILLEPILDREE